MEDIEIFGHLFTVSPISTTVLNTYDTVVIIIMIRVIPWKLLAPNKILNRKKNSEFLSIKKPYMYN